MDRDESFSQQHRPIFVLILSHRIVLCPVLNKENSQKVIGKLGILLESNMDIPRKKPNSRHLARNQFFTTDLKHMDHFLFVSEC